jgi:oxaloacetate decarboxylase gamma subunit
MQSIESTSQLFSQAATLMGVGMAFVFLFLSLMILVIKYLITPLAKKFPDPLPQVKKPNNSSKTQNASIVAAISVAVKKYRENTKN